MSEEIQFKCEECGQLFDPTPDAMVEWNMEAEYLPDCEDENVGYSPEEIMAMNEWDLKAIGLTPQMRDDLMSEKPVKFGGCICLKCQNEMLEQQ